MINNLPLELEVQGTKVNLEADLAISTENINQAFMEQSAKFAYWATLAAQAKSLVEQKKLEVDKQDDYMRKTLIGELDSKVREDLDNEGIKITESKVQARIYASPQYKVEAETLSRLKQELVELQKQLYLMDVAKESMEQRKDMLVSLGAMIRANVTSDLVIK